MKDLLAPEHWSQVAVDVLAQKYFRKAGACPGHRPCGGNRRPRMAAAGVPRPATPLRAGDRLPPGVPALGRLLDLLGLEGRLLLAARRTPGPSTTRFATCWPARWRRRTARSGSIPGCPGPTASRAAPGTLSSIPGPNRYALHLGLRMARPARLLTLPCPRHHAGSHHSYRADRSAAGSIPGLPVYDAKGLDTSSCGEAQRGQGGLPHSPCERELYRSYRRSSRPGLSGT